MKKKEKLNFCDYKMIKYSFLKHNDMRHNMITITLPGVRLCLFAIAYTIETFTEKQNHKNNFLNVILSYVATIL